MDDVADKALTMLRELRSITFSTVENGLPKARIADVMGYEDGKLLCCVGNTKPFYCQLKETGKVTLVGMTPNFIMIRLEGDIMFADEKEREKIFENNPDLANLFPDETSRSTLKPYFVYRGKGEIFDLSGEERKMQRERFSFGGYSVNLAGCFITEDCTACGICLDACPFGAISEGEPYVIDTRYCDECGVCYSLCPVDAIELPKGM